MQHACFVVILYAVFVSYCGQSGYFYVSILCICMLVANLPLADTHSTHELYSKPHKSFTHEKAVVDLEF